MDPICRLCMEVSNLNQTISDQTVLTMVENCVQIKFDIANDVLPLEICDDCYYTIKDFSEFKENCHTIQDMLRKEIEQSGLEDNLEDSSVLDLFDGDIRYSDVEYINENLFDDISTDDLFNDILNNNEPQEDKSDSVQSPIDSPECSRDEKKKRVKRSYKDEYTGALVTCEICGKMVHKTLIPGHLNMHKGIKPYTCPRDGCKSSFHCKHKLKRHIGYKHSDGNYPCDKCDKVLNSGLALYHHRFATHQERDKTCNDCGKQFRTTHGLNRHMTIHNKEAKFKCSYCSMAFLRESSLEMHTRMHTKERPYVCVKCSADYSHQRLLENHIKRKHPEAPIVLRPAAVASDEPEVQDASVICVQRTIDFIAM
ncbi:gastrula zinc finger protein XlCGF52.1-like [Wyeomyia smithii]|uniref:gastrula zinc finger protein XlCGF52.1-like n=1 Tax=Wyeomyia smithii TaxID=174621 RepID=UPI0024680F1A|nr:gastrula zinc finger protein XlCGF52.1-like [Wyeomyia smithii]XP_055546925.1 gastrula zinc finger protein XlCGF52.1-like [Wyeomyia smithii]XP_055546926.1 gastrula zinc finger protein XlCGF52.1-like [Wyeomyia smithii]XP_055546927.1 gastrula zinc finger protein XlCGF52.1-like [Wyeomyia smithii]XP_055546928.1 gastrula zinc finger protein XlCGF52.1-like [Wyeomyia smithii]XP_055546929.1 gastrula zinc finger protein XlCGF52.1-like [Wyeomyia smithii]